MHIFIEWRLALILLSLPSASVGCQVSGVRMNVTTDKNYLERVHPHVERIGEDVGT